MSRSLRIACILAAAISPAIAHAAADINIAWNECILGAGNAANLNFACNVNTGTERMYASFRPPANSDQFRGLVGTVLVTFDDSTVPSWWHFESTGCRAGHLGTIQDFTAGPFGCTDVWESFASAASVIDIGFGSPNVMRVRSIVAVAPTLPLTIDTAHEYYAYALQFNNTKTTGTGLCDGCATGVCIVLTQMELDYADNSFTIVSDGAQRFITWQGGGSIPCPGATPTRNRSWGMIKTLYR
jgi:hypothetical protein